MPALGNAKPYRQLCELGGVLQNMPLCAVIDYRATHGAHKESEVSEL